MTVSYKGGCVGCTCVLDFCPSISIPKVKCNSHSFSTFPNDPDTPKLRIFTHKSQLPTRHTIDISSPASRSSPRNNTPIIRNKTPRSRLLTRPINLSHNQLYHPSQDFEEKKHSPAPKPPPHSPAPPSAAPQPPHSPQTPVRSPSEPTQGAPLSS